MLCRCRLFEKLLSLKTFPKKFRPVRKGISVERPHFLVTQFFASQIPPWGNCTSSHLRIFAALIEATSPIMIIMIGFHKMFLRTIRTFFSFSGRLNKLHQVTAHRRANAETVGSGFAKNFKVWQSFLHSLQTPCGKR